MDFRSWKEKTACVTPSQGRHSVGQSQGQGQGGQHSEEGSLGGSVWLPRVHICLYSTGSGLSSRRSGGTGGVWWFEAASTLSACGTHSLYRSRASGWGGGWTTLHPVWRAAKVVVPACPRAGTQTDAEPPGLPGSTWCWGKMWPANPSPAGALWESHGPA